MPFRIDPPRSFKDLFKDGGTAAGMFLNSGDSGVAEICAGAGLDYLLIDGEHGPMGLESVLDQLRAIAGYPPVAVVRVPANDPVVIKQFLDIGAQSLIVPMVHNADQARQAVQATQYPPEGVRGVGAALARSARWNRVPDYLARANDFISLLVQVESVEAVANTAAIAATEGIDGIFIGPADMAATMGLLGQQDHPEVVESVMRVIRTVKAQGKIVGVNAFQEPQARAYAEAGADFINVGADVALLARGSEALAAKYCRGAAKGTPAPASY